MSKHLFRLLFGAMFLVAATAFTGCTDDDNKSLTPKLTVDPTSLTFFDETETTQTVAIQANCEWQVTASNLDWATISPMSGKGNQTLTVTVSELPAGTNQREGKISFTLIHPEFDKWGQAESSVAVKQFGSGVVPPPTGDAIYANDFDKEQATQTSSKWPFADVFEGWKNQTGTGADNVTYVANSMSVRANSFSNGNYSKYKDDASGVNNMFFGSGAEFEIHKIALASTQKNLCLTFGSYRSVFDATDNAFVTSEFHVYLSQDGESWAEIAYDRPVEADEHSNYGTWGLATANFTLKEVPAELYIRFISDLASVHRIDDVKLFEGVGGAEVDLGNIAPPVTETKTIAEVIAGSVGSTYTTQGQVVAINGRSFLIQDNTGKMLVYRGWKDNKPVIDYTAAIGQTVKVTGKTTTYSKLVQFAETDLVIEKVSDGSFTQPAPEKFDGAAFEAYAAATPVVKYIEYSGTLTIEGYYYNIAVDGTSLQGSLAYPAEGFVDASLNGEVVVVKGYTLGMTNQNKMLSTIAVSVEKDGEAPAEPKITKLDPASLTFAATDNAKTVTVTAANDEGCTIEASTNNTTQFTTSVNGMVVTVTPAENTTEQAINATLTIKLMKDGAAVDTKTAAITQAGKSTGGGATVTMTYTDIVDGGTTKLPTNGYGSQNTTNEATYYKWSFSSIDFGGVKVCVAPEGDYTGLIQMQGNASDPAKQGFLGNVTSLGKITKIVVVTKNTRYEPSVNLYLGTDVYPTTNVQNHPTATKDGDVYTEVYNISGDYGYFRLWNDSVGATYVQSISITYEK